MFVFCNIFVLCELKVNIRIPQNDNAVYNDSWLDITNYLFFVKQLAISNNRDKGGVDVPLTMLKQGNSGIVKELRGQSASVKHLGDLGFVAGTPVRVITELNGNLIIELKGSRLALNKVTASRIILVD